MAANELTGNMPTENVIAYFKEEQVDLGINDSAFAAAKKLARQVF